MDDIQDIAQQLYGRRKIGRQQQDPADAASATEPSNDDENLTKSKDDNDDKNVINDKTDDDDHQRLRPCQLLAPMVRACSVPLRTLALRYGADLCYSEEYIDRSLSSTTRVVNDTLGTIDYVKDKSNLSRKVKRKLGDRPCLILRISQRDELPSPQFPYGRLICQIGTGEPELALPAAQRVFQDVSSFDINMGCPKKFSVSGGMGSALLTDPDRASRIIKSIRNNLPSTVPSGTSLQSSSSSSSSMSSFPRPVSCKIRLLKTTSQTVEFIESMIHAGANAVAIHARRVGHHSTVAADWDCLEEVLSLVRPKYPHIALLLNGDFYDRQERYDFMDRTNVDGVLLGRPALYNTSTFRTLSSHPELVDKTTVIQEYVKEAVRYDTHPKNVKYVICEMMSNRRTPTERVLQLPIQFPGGQTIAKTCDCQDIESLCQVWNVQYSDAVQYKQKQCAQWQSLLLDQPTSSSSLSTSSSSALGPLMTGEHRYDDSYFLQHESTGNSTNGDKNKNSITDPESRGIGRKEEGATKNEKNDGDDDDDDDYEDHAYEPVRKRSKQ